MGTPPAALASEIDFVDQDLGLPVQFSEPVDLEGDGIWELAVQVGQNGDSVGVYSPLRQQWVDGPHHVPLENNNWGCGDIDGDTKVEYVYLRGAEIHVYDPTIGSDEAVFSVDLVGQLLPPVLQLWGRSDSGQPTVCISHTEKKSRIFCETIEDSLICGETHQWLTDWRRYSLPDGQLLGETRGAGQKGRLCFTNEDIPTPLLCVFDHDRAEYNLDSANHWWEGRHSISLLETDGHERDLACVLLRSYWGDAPAWWPGWPGLLHVALGSADPHFLPHVFYHHIDAEGFPQQLSGITMAKWCGPDWSFGDSLFFAGLATYRLEGYDYPVLLLPRSDRDLWEIREPYFGGLIDSLPGLSPADIRTAPILEAAVLDLYYFDDSKLYILNRPDMPTEILAEDLTSNIPNTIILYQNHPNPFNASTIIACELATPGHLRLEIYDICGRRIATLLDEYCPAGISRVVWAATGRDGRDVVSGVYFARATIHNATVSRKIVLVK